MKITNSQLRQIIKEEIQEMTMPFESRFKVGARVSWNTLKKVIKTSSTGRQKIDYDRVLNTGVIDKRLESPGSTLPNVMVKDEEGTSHEVEVADLTLI
jgi:hypothetical protein|tara:strand:+ start:6211 stop:6504 length:294 start_codon:yes stop_codon:yes gene_type:complete